MTQARAGSIEHWAEVRPDHIALVEGPRQLSWAELNQRANAFAHGLRALGIAAGDIVAVRTHIRIEWLVIASAVSRLGCTMVGMNWRLTQAETLHLLNNSRAVALICDDEDLATAKACRAAQGLRFVVSIDTPDAECVSYESLLRTPGEPLYSQADPSLLIYTSGTTGLPKGVAVGQGNVDAQTVREYRESQEPAGAGAPDDGVQLVTMPMHHASGPNQMWAAVRKARKIVLMRRFEPEAALAEMQAHRVTAWSAVPTMYKRIAGLPPEVVKRYDISSVKRVSVGAAPVPHALKLWILEHFGRLSLQENYGSTETSMVCSLSPDMQEKKPGASGKPFRHVSIEVRSPEGTLLPAGEVGELWIKTPLTIRNYLNAPPLPADTLDARGFFRVGDVGYVDEDGYLFITDRTKDMVISGGVNIYPAEIEAVLMQHPAVQDVAVIGIPDDEFGEQVLAFCQLKAGQGASVDELQAHAARQLASYKRPRRIELVNDLPRNTMGKVLKRELRAPYWQGKERQV
ncbi:MAG: class I adenylate-forming enzyme family protein [Rhizobacter sp.]